MRVAVDIGYGYLKALNEFGDRLHFPSYVAPAPVDVQAPDLFGGGKPNVYRVDGSLYLVGKDALESRYATLAYDREKWHHEATRVLLAVSVYELKRNFGSSDVHLITGLPYDQFFREQDSLRRMLSDFRAEVENLFHPTPGGPVLVQFKRVTVFPQGAASVYSAYIGPDGSVRRMLDHDGALVVVVNVGYRTVDVAAFRVSDRAFRADRNLSFTLDDAGVVFIRHAISDAALRLTGRRMKPLEAERVLLSGGRFLFRGREFDVSADIRRAKQSLALRIRDALAARIGDELDFVTTVILAGGGSEDLREDLKTIHPSAEMHPDGPFADATGYLVVGRQVEDATRLTSSQE